MADYSVLTILDSNNREAFINPIELFAVSYSREEATPDEISLQFFDDTNAARRIEEILVNGDVLELNTDKKYCIKNGYALEDYYFLIYRIKDVELEFDYRVEISYGKYNVVDSFLGKIASTLKSVSNNTAYFDNAAICLTNTNSSYQLIRTNPKLSGNIKLVIDSNQNLFLDTFKVSDNLSDTKYRHKSISAFSNYSTDVRNVFRTLDVDDLYKVADNDLKAHEPFTTFEQQYQTIYEFGAETNDDELYQENFKLLAPLWLNRNLPDFFVVFKIPNAFNIASYSVKLNDTELFDEMLKNGVCVKVFDMRESSPIGKYLKNHLDNIAEYPGSVLLQFKEQETQSDYENGVNSFFGISVDSGLVVKKDEISYFANETIKLNSQEKLNQFIIDGFKRNKLLCPNLINLEWMFNDETSPNYQMNRYFGLYMKENDIVTYDYVEQLVNSRTKKIEIKKFDSEHNEIEDDFISGENSVLNNEEYGNRMFFGVGTKTVERLKEPNDLTNFLRKEVTSKPYKNYQICEARKVETAYSNFLTFQLLKNVRYGEHFKVVVRDFVSEGVSEPVVFEIIASNDARLANEIDCVSPYICVSNSRDTFDDYVYYRHSAEKPKEGVSYQKDYYRGISTAEHKETFGEFPFMKAVKALQEANGRKFNPRTYELEDASVAETTDYNKYPYIFRISFYTQDLMDATQAAPISTQISRIANAIHAIETEFNLKFHVAYLTNDAMSIVTSYKDVYFQHITADILDNNVVEIVSKKADVFECGIEQTDASLSTNFKDVYYDEITDASLGYDETLVYFGNKDLNIPLVALDNKSDNFKDDLMVFAPINFELLGWRKTSIVKFLTLEGYSYEIDSDDVSKIIPNTIVRDKDGKYSRLNDYSIVSLDFDYQSPIKKVTDKQEYYDNLVNKVTREVEWWTEELIQPHTTEEILEIREIRDRYLQELIDIKSYKDNLYEFVTNRSKTRKREIVSYLNRIQSPFNLDRYIINSDVDIFLDVDGMGLYSPQSISVSLMGILPIKDFDTTIGIQETKNVNNNSVIEFEKKTKIEIDGNDVSKTIRRNVLYTLKNGKFKDIPISVGSSFVIINDNMYFAAAHSNVFKVYTISDNYLEVANIKTKLKLAVKDFKIGFDYNITSPLMKEKYFHTNDDMKEDLRYSLVSPTVCNWKGVGGYYDHDSILKIENILKADSKGIFKGYMCFYNPNLVNSDNNMFVNRTLDSLIDDYGEKKDFLTYITEGSIQDSINQFLVNGKEPDYTVGYYNKYIDTLDFILYGVKFSLKFNSNEVVSGVRLQNYNKYEIYIVNDFNGNKNDVIVNTLENTILIVNHNFNFASFDYNENIFFTKDGRLLPNEYYKWTTTDKYLTLDETESDGAAVYIPVSTETQVSRGTRCDKFVQLDRFEQNDFLYDKRETNSLFYLDVSTLNSKDLISVYLDGEGNRLTYADEGYLLVEQLEAEDVSVIMTERYLKYPVQSSFLNNYVSKSSTNNSVMIRTNFEFGSKMVNSHDCWMIDPYYENVSFVDANLSDLEKFNEMKERFINSFREDDMVIYVKTQSSQGVSLSKIETSPTFKPLSISTSVAHNVKYCTDFYNPNFKDVVEFDINETDELIRKTKTNFILSNTKFSSISKIKNYYGFKIFNDMNHNLTNTTNMFVIDEEKSLVASNWDYQYYRRYSDSETFEYVDGYLTGIEDKSFFGTHALCLRNSEVLIDRWNESEISVTDKKVSDYSTESADKTVTDGLLIEINLNAAFYNHFADLDNDNFKKNWQFFSDNRETAINNFIKKTLIKYFKINDKNNFKLYSSTRKYNTNLLLEKPVLFDSEFTEIANFKSYYKNINDEIRLYVELEDKTKTYYATYDFRSNL